jgi:putative ABC transport system substrate-binding protein
MKRKTGQRAAGLRRRVKADTTRGSTRRALLLAVAGWPLLAMVDTVSAQQKNAPVLVGWLDLGSRKLSEHRLAAFKEGFAALGWKEGTDYRLEERWADGSLARLQPLAKELAAKMPALIVAAPGQSTAAAAKAAPKTPIVQANGDPMMIGLVTSLARPGGMVTGVSNINSDINEKFLELLLAAAPNLKRVGFLLDPTNHSMYGASLGAARRSSEEHRIEARYAEAARPEDIEPAILRLAKEGAQALVVLSSGWFVAERRRIVGLALQQRWPTIASQREFAEAGALLSYGADRTALYRRAATYVDKILKGAKPGDLPIEQPTKFELVVNAKSAKALGLTMTSELLLRADRVIE